MQFDVDTIATTRAIRIMGVNAAGEESGNTSMCQGRTLPWLQDTPQKNVWAAWSANWRDVIILDDQNTVVAVYNLTVHDISKSASCAEPRTILLNAAGPPPNATQIEGGVIPRIRRYRFNWARWWISCSCTWSRIQCSVYRRSLPSGSLRVEIRLSSEDERSSQR